MDYHLLREFADSWALLALTCFFAGVILWAYRPGSSRAYRDTANIPFRNEDRPAAGCAGDCGSCGCGPDRAPDVAPDPAPHMAKEART
ncbi:cbb3-type cytochrome oxidase subunit 3 [Frigidibacter oleivorans]|uniref:cbb3-type cytochrome oxidase subunit 3 n=1 Tax=Frigidibacter oleivorans TaxID=2487129 RepID=UPI000F8E1D69|nr:cbb3-type cytochrome c oxidase subunit 3 [Frigidibacter oleivorans]